MKWIIVTILFILASCVPTAKNYPLPIVTDDTPPEVSVAVNSSAVFEYQPSTTISAKLSKVWSKPVTIPINFYGTATLINDYTMTATSITIPAGSLTGSLTLSITQDTLTEANETIIAVLKTPTNGTLSKTKYTQTVTIIDDEVTTTLPYVNFSATTYNITELNGTHTESTTIKVNLSTNLEYDLYVPVTVSTSSTATNNVDYNFGQTYIYVPAGATSGYLPITILGDTLFEGSTAETVSLALSSPVYANLGTQITSTVNINEDDLAPTIQFATPLTPSVTEGTSSINVTVQLTSPSATPSTFKIVATAGSAAVGNDYNFNNDSVTLTIPAYTTSFTTSINIMDDNLWESVTPENFSLTLSGINVSVTSVPLSSMIININDNETLPVVTFNTSNITISESSSVVTVDLTASVPSQAAYTVAFTTTSSTATNGTDYTPSNAASISMPAYATSTSMTYTLIDDTWGETTEAIVYTISNLSSSYSVGTNGTHTTSIIDNDPIPTINFNTTSLVTSESTTTVTVGLSLSNPSGSTVSGTVAVTGGTAVGAGTDYTFTGGSYSFSPGSTTGPTTPLTITIVNDPNDEINETVQLTISSATNAVIGVSNTYILTITDDDATPTVNITPVAGSYGEAAGTFLVTATLSPLVASGLPITVSYSLSGTATRSATGDYDISGTYGTITIPAGSTSASETITITDDSIYESATAETIIWSTSAPSNGIMGTGSLLTWSITDNDTLPTVTFASTTSSVTESSTTQIYNVSISNPSSQTITVPVTVTGSTATNGADYTYSPGSVVFPGCDETPCTTTASINVPIIDDSASENNETVVLTLGAPTTGVGAGANLVHTLTINDEDLVVNFSTSTFAVTEGNNATLVLQIASPHTIPVGETLDVPLTITGTAISGSDFTAFSTLVSFTSASTSKNVVIPTIDDNFNEKAETVIVTIGTPVYSGVTYEGVIGTTSVGTATISSSDPVTTLSLGANHTCVTINVTGNDTIKCWGDNSTMQSANATISNNIGDQTNEMGSSLSALSSVTSYTQVAAGKNHTCAIDGTTVKCWGDDSFGQVGDGAPTGPYSSPQAVSGLGGTVTQIAVGDNHSCALISGGTVKCWGDNTFGQLGMDAPTSSENAATSVSILTGIISIAAGGDHTCALQGTPRKVYCWGDNDYGQLGQDNTNNIGDVAGEIATLSADPITFLSGYTPDKLALGKDHSCALSTSGAALCWGKNLYGQLGVDNVNAYGSSPTYPMSSLIGINTGATSFSKVSAGGDSTCLITTGNLLQCFGSNTYGQLGIESIASVGQNIGDMIAIHTTDLGSSLYATNVSLGLNHTCAILNNGQIKCWGLNSFGQLGLENTTIKGDNSGEMGSNLSSPSF